MKFTCTITIEKPLKRVIQLFDNVANLKEWQDGFVSLKHISGQAGKAGAVSMITINAGKNIIELKETIQVKNLPTQLTALYEHKQMDNTATHRFTALSEHSTLWKSEVEYIRLKGFVPRFMATLFPGVFKKQTQKWLNNFKRFAERN